MTEVGLSSFIAFAERRRRGLHAGEREDPRQDDYDIWLGTVNFQPGSRMIAQRPGNYLFLDGHAELMSWSDAVPLMFPDRVVLVQDGSYP